MTVHELPNKTMTENSDLFEKAWKDLAQPVLDAVPDSTLLRFGYNQSSYQLEFELDSKVMPMTIKFAQALKAALLNEAGESEVDEDFAPDKDDDVLF